MAPHKIMPHSFLHCLGMYELVWGSGQTETLTTIYVHTHIQTINVYIHTYTHLLHICMCVCVPQHVYEGQRTTYRSQLSPSPIWVLGLKLRPSSLARSVITNKAALSPTHNLCFHFFIFQVDITVTATSSLPHHPMGDESEENHSVNSNQRHRLGYLFQDCYDLRGMLKKH